MCENAVSMVSCVCSHSRHPVNGMQWHCCSRDASTATVAVLVAGLLAAIVHTHSLIQFKEISFHQNTNWQSFFCFCCFCSAAAVCKYARTARRDFHFLGIFRAHLSNATSSGVCITSNQWHAMQLRYRNNFASARLALSVAK